MKYVKKIEFILAALFMLLYLLNRLWHIPGERSSKGVVEYYLFD